MKAATLFGKPLPDGGCIGVPAPSSPYFNRSEILRGVEWWESKGYRVKLAEGAFDRDDYVAGIPRPGPATSWLRSPIRRSTSCSASRAATGPRS